MIRIGGNNIHLNNSSSQRKRMGKRGRLGARCHRHSEFTPSSQLGQPSRHVQTRDGQVQDFDAIRSYPLLFFLLSIV